VTCVGARRSTLFDACLGLSHRFVGNSERREANRQRLASAAHIGKGQLDAWRFASSWVARVRGCRAPACSAARGLRTAALPGGAPAPAHVSVATR
jgi:hypothetical protein